MEYTSHNRLEDFVEHNPHLPYLFHGPYTKVAREVGVAPSTVSRLRRGLVTKPAFTTVVKLTEFFEHHYGRQIDPREIIYPGGTYRPRFRFDER